MAKFGEGDSRWIVQDRADGANVNSWHWTEKDCMEWSRNELAKLLEAQTVLDGEGGLFIRTGKLEKVDGDAYVNIRKGKIIPGYELHITLSWEGEAKNPAGGETLAAVKGTAELPYVADENHDEEPEVKIALAADSADGAGPLGHRLREAMLAKGRPIIARQVAEFVKEIRSGGPAKDALAKAKADEKAGKGGSSGTGVSDVSNAAAKPSATSSAGAGSGAGAGGAAAGAGGGAGGAAAAASAVAKAGGAGKPVAKGKDGMKTLTLTQSFHCRPADLYRVLMEEKSWMACTQSRAQISKEQGGAFAVFDGAVVGTNQRLEQDRLIMQKWRFNTWPEGHFSTVCMTIEEPQVGNTVLRLTHTDIPEEDRFGNATVVETTERGWLDLIFGRIRAVYGY